MKPNSSKEKFSPENTPNYHHEENQPEPYNYIPEEYIPEEKIHTKAEKDLLNYSPQEFDALRKIIKESNLLHLSFHFLDYILRLQKSVFEQIYTQQKLPKIIISMSILCVFLSGIYGLTMGMNHSFLLAISSAIKLPMLFLLTAVICIPSLYTFNVMLGQKFKFLQTVALMIMTLGTTTILLASLAPLSFFFVLTTRNYFFLQLMHVSILGLCGIYGVYYLYRGCSYVAFRMEQPLNKLLLKIWIVIYAVVGMQLGWRLRPFIGTPGSPFEIFRVQEDGNFYLAVWESIMRLLEGNAG